MKSRRWKPTDDYLLADIPGYPDIDREDVVNLLGYLREAKLSYCYPHIQVVETNNRFKLYSDTKIPEDISDWRGVVQWFMDRSPAEITNFAKSLRDSKIQYELIEISEWYNGFEDWMTEKKHSILEEPIPAIDTKTIDNITHVYIFYHNDHDGMVSGRIAGEFYKDFEKTYIPITDYSQDIKDLIREATNEPFATMPKGYLFIFVDYSFSSIINLGTMSTLQKYGYNVIWIDHHKTSCDYQKDDRYTWTNSTKGIRSDKLSGAALTYLYFFTAWYYDKVSFDVDLKRDMKEIPTFIKYIDSYDRFAKYMPNTDEFHYGLSLSNPEDHFFDENPLWFVKPNEANQNEVDSFINEIIQFGSDYLKKYDEDNRYHLKNAFEVEIKNNETGTIYKGVALNRQGPSRQFLDLYTRYDFVCPFYYNGNKYIYSIYIDKDRRIELSAEDVCKSFGGGGHLTAAGFQCRDNIFTYVTYDSTDGSHKYTIRKIKEDK